MAALVSFSRWLAGGPTGSGMLPAARGLSKDSVWMRVSPAAHVSPAAGTARRRDLPRRRSCLASSGTFLENDPAEKVGHLASPRGTTVWRAGHRGERQAWQRQT